MILSPPDFHTVGAVLRALPEDYEARVHSRFRALGGDSSRWQRRDWVAMAGAVTRLEDWLELERPRFDRTPLRTARRALENADDALDRPTAGRRPPRRPIRASAEAA